MATPTPSSDRSAQVLKLMKEGDDAFNAQDFDAMKAAHHPDMIAHVTGNAEPIHGRDAHAEAMAAMFRTFPDVHVHNDPYPVQFADGDWMTVITNVTGTFSGELLLPDGNVIPGTGKPFDLTFSTTARWDGELLVEEWASWDAQVVGQQIGLG